MPMSQGEHDAFLGGTKNPYEMIVLAAREAERINARRVTQLERKPTTIALERVTRGEAEFTIREETAKSDGPGAQRGPEAEGGEVGKDPEESRRRSPGAP